jgi:hypothetical protein
MTPFPAHPRQTSGRLRDDRDIGHNDIDWVANLDVFENVCTW